jgi:hypothetical protein
MGENSIMIIQLLHTYGGKLIERKKLAAGIYSDLPDSLARYLVDNGHARVIEDTEYVLGVDVAEGRDYIITSDGLTIDNVEIVTLIEDVPTPKKKK